jgi:hypothetical protein
MKHPELSFDDDAGDRIACILAEKGVASRHCLDPAVRVAGHHIELLKPMVMGWCGGRMYAGPVAAVRRGVILIVLANAKKVATIGVPDQPNREQVVSAAVSYVLPLSQSACGDDRAQQPANALHTVNFTANKFGAAPGKAMPALSSDAAFRILGFLFAPTGAAMSEQIWHDAIGIAAKGVCPALVGLIGEGLNSKPGTLSGVWPVVLPIAPYQETIGEDSLMGATNQPKKAPNDTQVIDQPWFSNKEYLKCT